MKNCTLKPFRGCGNSRFGTSVSVTNPSAPVGAVWPDTTRGVARMNTFAPLTGRPPRAVIRTRTVIGAVLLRTGFGENWTDATTRRSPPALSSLTGTAPVAGGGGWFEPTTPVGFEMAEVEPR